MRANVPNNKVSIYVPGLVIKFGHSDHVLERSSNIGSHITDY